MIRVLSIVVPCYREAVNLPRLRDELVALRAAMAPLEFDVILVNDGSPDNTFEVAWSISQQDRAFRTLSFSRNFGKEAAMLAGLRAARGDAVIIMDADLQHPPELIPDLVRRHEETGAGQVIARRTRRGDPFLRTLLSRAFYRFVNALIDVELTDGVGDFRLLSRRAVDALLQLAERNRFSKGLFAWIGFPVELIDYDNVGRQAGQSSWGFRSLFNYAIDGVISFNDRPLRKLSGLGAIAAVMGFAYLVFLVVDYFHNGVAAPGYFTTIGVVTMFGGVQLVSLVLLGEYVGRIYSEVKQRPHYIVAHDSRQELLVE